MSKGTFINSANFKIADINERQKQFEGPNRRSGGKLRGVRFAEAADLPRSKLALTIMKYIMRHPLNKSIVMRKNLSQIEEISELLKVVKVFYQVKVVFKSFFAH